MKRLSLIGMIVGLLVLTGLVIWQGIGELFNLLAASGWGLLLLPLVWVPCLYFTSESWRMLFRKAHQPTFLHALFATWMGRSINNLLPVATIGGEIIKTRLVTLWGNSGIEASAAMLVDKTVQVLAVIVWGLIGIGILLFLALDNTLALTALAGFGLLALGAFGFFKVQKSGLLNILAKIGSRLLPSDSWAGITNNAQAVDKTILDLYGNFPNIFLAVLIKSIGLIVQTAEVWLACYLLGYPVSLLEAMLLKSLTSTLSDVAFVIPNAYGIQEGAFIMVGSLLGMGPDIALSASLAIRIRELIIDIPGLLVWQSIEGKYLMMK